MMNFLKKLFIADTPQPVPAPPKTVEIFIYGHSASGKSTFIQRTFTLGTQKLNSTEHFDYYEFVRQADIGSDTQLRLRIADYRGQNPAQLLEQLKQNRSIDCLLFMADIAPAYSTSRKPYTTEDLLTIMGQDVEKCIYERLKEQEAYLSKFLIQIIFQYAVNPQLKSVYFLINKIDLLEKLQAFGKLDSRLDIEEYAKSFYKPIIDEIRKFCDVSNISDFQTHCISNHQYKNIHQIISNIVSTYSNK